MTETDWLTSTAPYNMLNTLKREWDKGLEVQGNIKVSHRKLRLFACAVARLREDTPPNPERTAVIDACEQIAEGLPSQFGSGDVGLRGARESIEAVWGWTWTCTCENVHRSLQETFIQMRGNSGNFYRQEKVADLLREIVGNPFQPVTLPCDWYCTEHSLKLDGARCDGCKGSPKLGGTYKRYPWLTPNVRNVAAAVYTDRTFTDMPILADALEDSGCDNVDILNHCRGIELLPAMSSGVLQATIPVPLRSPHVRGCWVLDLILGKE